MADAKVVLERLNNFNWASWKFRMELLLVKEELYDCVMQPKPEEPTPQWKVQDGKARAIIGLALENDQLCHVMSAVSANEMWVALKSYHQRDSLTNKIHVLRRLFSLRLSTGGDMSEHLMQVTESVHRLNSIGEKLEDHLIVAIILSSLPESYSALLSALESRPVDELKLEFVKGKLLDEWRRRQENKMVDRAMKVSGPSGRYDSGEKKKKLCHHCKQEGHFCRDCPKLVEDRQVKNSESAKNKSQQKVKVSVAQQKEEENLEVCFSAVTGEADCLAIGANEPGDNKWLLDSGCTKHMTGKAENLEVLSESNEVVCLANGGKIPAKGIGTGKLRVIGGNENMKITATTKMATPIEEKIDQNLKTRSGMVMISDGKSKPELARLHLTMEVITIQKQDTSTPVPTPTSATHPPIESKERMVQITRQKVGGLGLSIKGGAEHKLPILISRIYKDQAADATGQLFVGDAIIKVNGEYITACPHDDAVNILRNAGDMVVLTVKHYRAATPFLQKQLSRETPESDNDATCAELKADEVWKSANNSRPVSISSEPENRWIDLVSVPLMMAYVTRYIYGTDKLRPNAFEVRGLNGTTTGIIHCDELAILSQWLKYITDNIVGLTSLQMKLYNRNFPVGERIEYMGWVNEGVISNHISWQSYKPRFLVLKGTEVMLFDAPPLNVSGLQKATVAYKVYQTMFRVVKESETVDSRQHCFLLQSSGHEPRYLSVETRQELLRIENSWNAAIVTSVIKLGRKTFAVSHHGKTGGLTLDWQAGFSLTEGADANIIWQYKFSQLRGSSDDGKSKLKLHFQDHETRSIETKELECQVLQSLLFCMHAFLTAKVASVDPAFLSSIQQA